MMKIQLDTINQDIQGNIEEMIMIYVLNIDISADIVEIILKVQDIVNDQGLII